MKNSIKFIGAVLMVLAFSIGNSFSQDTVYVFNGDTTTTFPTGKVAVDTTVVVDSVVSFVTQIDTTDVEVADGTSNSTYSVTVQNDNSTVDFRIFRIGSVATMDVNVSVNGNTIVEFLNNFLNNEPNSSFDSTLTLNSGDVVSFTASNSGVFGVDLSVSSEVVTYNSTVVITVDYPQSVENVDKVSFTLYPNPVVDQLNFTFSDFPSQVVYQIFDMGGKQVMFDQMFGNTVNVSSLPNGMYILQVNIDGETVTDKFLKRN